MEFVRPGEWRTMPDDGSEPEVFCIADYTTREEMLANPMVARPSGDAPDVVMKAPAWKIRRRCM
jgi:hypothetical protein